MAPHQQFSDLHSVQGSALEELVASKHHRNGVARRISVIRTETACKNFIRARCFNGHGEVVSCPIINNAQARRADKNLLRFFRPNRAFELD